MLSIWSCSPCVVLLLAAVLGREVRASHVGKRHKDLLDRVEKAQAQITAFPKKREASICTADYTLCPASLNGGCCPPRYGCATDACYATTAGTQSACGMTGWYNCGAAVGGGCCPEGYICGQNNCIPPAGVSSIVQNCPADYYLCPASFNYGCCLTGYGCATNVCYITTPSTITYTQTATTTVADGQTVTTTRTATTVQTPTPPTALPTTTNADAIAKFIPTTVAKVPATSTPSSDGSGGGLTTPQLGGIIGGAIAILIVVIAAAVIVIRRLNRVADVVETRKASSSGDQSKPARPGGGRGRPNMTQYGMSYDPLMVGTPADSGPGTPQGISGGLEVDGRNRSNSDYSQPAVTPYGYSGTPSEGQRHPSLDSSQGGGYFDIPARVHNMPARHSMRTRTDSQGNVQYGGGHVHISQQQPQHGRQWSNASEFSNDSSDHQPGVGSPLIPAELDIAGGFIPELPSADAISPDGDGTRRRSGSGTIGSPRPSLGHSRRHSSGTSAAAGAGMPSPGSVAGHQPLDVVNESSEIMHGHYGPRYNQAGQTAAGLDIHDDVSSPLAVRFTERRHGQ